MMTRFATTMIFVLATHAAPAIAADEQSTPFAPICAEREVQVITLLEDHARAQDTAADALGEAGLTRMEAQTTCYAGRVAEAVSLYDGIISGLGPVLMRATR
jgi:hypothetical protein